jgi:hypothetical protein
MNRVNRAWMAVVALAFAGCVNQKAQTGDAKQCIVDYINKSFSIKKLSERSQLEAFLTGEAHTRMKAWSEAQFYRAFIESKREFGKLVFKETKNVSDDEMNVVYELSYMDQGRGHDAKVTQKKMATLTRKNGVWLIETVRNLKELIEFRNELALP